MPTIVETQATVILRNGFEAAINDVDGSGYLLGTVYDNDETWHIFDTLQAENYKKALHSEWQIIGKYKSSGGSNNTDTDILPDSYLDITISEGEVDSMKIQTPEKTIKNNISSRSIRSDRFFIRLDNDDDNLNELKDKKVGIIGVGSGGSLLATYLAKSGVKNLVLIDGDRYEEHNIVRHLCSMDDIGRKKTLATKEFIKNRIPDVNIDTLEEVFKRDTTQKEQKFLEMLGDCDLIVSATGAHNINFEIESFVQSLDANIPVLYAGMFENLKGGILMRVDESKDDPSYHEAYEDVVEEDAEGVDVQSVDVEGTYQSPEEEDAHSEPGLGIDVDNLTVFLAKRCLYELLEDQDHNLYQFDESVYVWANRQFDGPSFEEDLWYSYAPLELTIIPESNIQ